jgi:hypothetical protein
MLCRGKSENRSEWRVCELLYILNLTDAIFTKSLEGCNQFHV